MIEQNSNYGEHVNDQPSTASEASVAGRIARAVGTGPLSDEAGLVAPPHEPFASAPAPELSVHEPVAPAGEPAPGQFDVSFEGAIRLLNERLAEVVRREAALGSKEQGVQQALAEADDRWAALVEKENEVERSLAEVAATRLELAARAASVDQREAALALYEEELEAVSAHVDAQQAELERLRLVEHDSGGGTLAAREAAVARRESDAETALAEAGSLRADAAETELAVAERERVMAERERALLESGPVQALSSSDYDAQARALTEAVKAVAKQEAETVLREAHEQAQLILESAHAERERRVLYPAPLAVQAAAAARARSEESDL